MLEISVSGLIFIPANIDPLEKENSMFHEGSFIKIMFSQVTFIQIAAKVLMIRKSLYL